MPTNINTNLLSFMPLVSRNAVDALLLPITNIDFTRDTTYVVDLTATILSKKLQNPIQSVYIDTSGVPFGATTFTVFATGQKIIVPAQTQGYYPLLVVESNYTFTLTNFLNLGQAIGTASVNVYFANIPMVASEWNINGDSSGGGGLQGGTRVVTAATDQAVITDYTILCNAASNAITEYLPVAGGVPIVLNIAKTDNTANVVTVNGNGFLIDNVSTFALVQPGESITVQWTGNNWKKLSQYPGIFVDWGAQRVQIFDLANPPQIVCNGQASIDLKDLIGTGTPALGSWWRLFADNVGGGGGNNTVGFYDVRNNRLPLGIDNNGRTNVLGLAVTGSATTTDLTATGTSIIPTLKGTATYKEATTGDNAFQLLPVANGAWMYAWTGTIWDIVLRLGSTLGAYFHKKATFDDQVIINNPEKISFGTLNQQGATGPGWRNWSMSVTGTGVSNVTSVAQYCQVGPMCVIKGVANFTLSGSSSGTVTVTNLPNVNIGEQQVVNALFYSTATGLGYSCYSVTVAGTSTLQVTLNAGATMPLGAAQIDIAFVQRSL